MIFKTNKIQYLDKADKWITYVNNNWIKWIHKNKNFEDIDVAFEFTDMTDINIKGELIIVREDRDAKNSSNSRPEYVKRIVFDDSGRFLINQR